MSIVYTTPTDELNTGTLHHFILQHIIVEGYAPKRLKMCKHFGVEQHEMEEALHALQAEHGVVLHPHEPEVWVMHPFATAPTNFLVSTEIGSWWSPCAWCSLGAVALTMHGEGWASIKTNLGAHFQQVDITFEHGMLNDEGLFVHFPIPMKKAWDNVIYTCSNMQVFKDEEQVDYWCNKHQIPKGDLQPLAKIWDFAQDWYGNHLDPNWEKLSVEKAKVIFDKHGLNHPVWNLGASTERF